MESTQPPQPSQNPFNAHGPETSRIVFSTESQVEETPDTILASALAEAGVEIDTANIQTDKDAGDQPNPQPEIALTAEDIAFGELLTEKFAELQPKLVWHLVRKTGTVRENAEDAVQLAFEAAWKHRAKYSWDDSAQNAWFYTVSFRFLRSEWQRKENSSTITTDRLPEQGHTDQSEYRTTYAAIMNGIDFLPTRQKMVATRLIADMGYQEIADDLGIAVGTVRSTARNLRIALGALAQTQNWR